MKKFFIFVLFLNLSLSVFGQLFPQTKEGFQYFILDGKVQLVGYKGNAKNVVIPNYINGFPVTVIATEAFYNKGLTSVVIPNTVTTIQMFAFYKNKLTKIVIPNSVTYIATGAFMDNQLVGVTIPNSVTHISADAFIYNKLTTVIVPTSVRNTLDYVFDENVIIRRQ